MGTYIHVHPDLVLFANVSNSQEGIKSPIHSGSSCGAHKERNKSLQKQESPCCVNRNSGLIYSVNFLRQGLAVWLSLTWNPGCRSASVCDSPPSLVWLYRHGHHTEIQGFLPLPCHMHRFNHQNCHRSTLATAMTELHSAAPGSCPVTAAVSSTGFPAPEVFSDVTIYMLQVDLVILLISFVHFLLFLLHTQPPKPTSSLSMGRCESGTIERLCQPKLLCGPAQVTYLELERGELTWD